MPVRMPARSTHAGNWTFSKRPTITGLPVGTNTGAPGVVVGAAGGAAAVSAGAWAVVSAGAAAAGAVPSSLGDGSPATLRVVAQPVTPRLANTNANATID